MIAKSRFMGTASVTRDYANANALTLRKWRETFGDALGIALTDTFGTETFLHNFRGDLAKQFAGVRQDSGDPKEFVDRIVDFYRDQKIDPSTKTIVFSDGLNVERCIELCKYAFEKGIKPSFGVGTFMTSKTGFLTKFYVNG
jgi:nicotinate phosphoribosyltransferase